MNNLRALVYARKYNLDMYTMWTDTRKKPTPQDELSECVCCDALALLQNRCLKLEQEHYPNQAVSEILDFIENAMEQATLTRNIEINTETLADIRKKIDSLCDSATIDCGGEEAVVEYVKANYIDVFGPQ